VKKLFIGFILLVSVVLALGFSTTIRSSKNVRADKKPQRNKLEEKIKEEVGKPTPIKEGVMTDKQRKHSKLFKRYESSTGGKKLRDMVEAQSEIFLAKMAGLEIRIDNDLNAYLRKLTCNASAVFLATVQSKSSQLLDEGTFTFTDYEMRIDEVLKNNSSSPIEPNMIVTYTGPGGAVELDGKVINAIDYRSEPLQLGEQYLIYAAFLPDTASYRGLDISGGDAFEIKHGVIRQASKRSQPLGANGTADSGQFMSLVRPAVYQSCAK